MIYNELGDSGIRVSGLGFGSMRWANEEQCHRIMTRGLDRGMNYVDTSTGYLDGKSQVWGADAIRDRRDEILFSSKSFWASAKSADTVRRRIEETLETLELDSFDLYQLWGLQSVAMLEKAMKRGGFIEGVRKAQDDGLIKLGVGFTFHGTPESFRAAVDTGEFLCATVSYNLAKRKEADQIRYAAEHGVGVIIMNPLGGGPLARHDDRKLDFLRHRGTGPSYGALRFLLADGDISTSLIGCATEDELEENLQAVEDREELTEALRRALVERMEDAAFTSEDICTGCGYCRDCPNDFDPSEFMELMRDFSLYASDDTDLVDWLRARYAEEGKRLDEELAKCEECGICEEKCPQHLPIVESIRGVKDELRR
ncbi:MAG: aldo/keto reductase [Planctomycetota bacterium]